MPSILPKHIILSRTDNIGDVILTLPMAVVIKKAMPDCKISMLARDYVKDILLSKPEIDDFISWDELQQGDENHAIQQLAQADTIIHVFPNRKIAHLAKKAKIKTRIGSMRKLYHLITCNRWSTFSRSNSDLHEAQLNLKILKTIGLPSDYSLEQIRSMVAIKAQPLSQAVESLLSNTKFNLILHPLSNGNGREWPLSYFKQLVDALPKERFQIIITGTQTEQERLAHAGLLNEDTVDAVGHLNLSEFISLLANSDGVVIGSTGPLHISSALGTHTLGLFPPDPSAGPHRWAGIGIHTENITCAIQGFCQNKCHNTDCACMRAIEVAQVKKRILTWEKMINDK